MKKSSVIAFGRCRPRRAGRRGRAVQPTAIVLLSISMAAGCATSIPPLDDGFGLGDDGAAGADDGGGGGPGGDEIGPGSSSTSSGSGGSSSSGVGSSGAASSSS